VERKRILRRAALIGAALLLAALVTAAVMAVAIQRSGEKQRAERDVHVAQLTKEYQAYLDEVAQKIKGVPVDPKVVGEIQTRHYQQRPALWLYVWATDNKGDFLFGVPSDAFARLNTAFDQYQAVIARDNHFASRDQFLRTLLHNSRRIGPPQDEGDDRRGPARDPDANWWRFHREGDDGEYSWGRSNVLFLSSPIQDAAGATVGNLNLKLVDLRDQRLYSSREDHPWRQIMEMSLVVCVLSLVWLWFMLPSWVYIDAQQRGVPRPLLWSLLTLIGSVFALMVYLISRPTDVKEFRCPHCGKTLNGSKAACPYCGADLSAVFCPRCQYPVKADWSFCPSCRGALARAPAASGEAATGI
jgi:RNA polymerase subunit RPABC4/transcription elongation factor Spt4